MDKDIPEIDLTLTKTKITAKSRKLDPRWKLEESKWMLFVNGVDCCAHWTRIDGSMEPIELDYDTAVDALSGDEEAHKKIYEVLPDDE